MKRSVSISIYRNGKILTVTNRRFGGFSLPGGKVEEGEDIEVAAYRELQEETGLIPRAMKYLGCSLFHNPMYPNSPSYLVSHYEAFVDNPVPNQMEEGTVPSWKLPEVLLNSEGSIFRKHYNKIVELGVIRIDVVCPYCRAPEKCVCDGEDL